ncbi:putative REJ domain-containing protein [Helianthus anomalus]
MSTTAADSGSATVILPSLSLSLFAPGVLTRTRATADDDGTAIVALRLSPPFNRPSGGGG